MLNTNLAEHRTPVPLRESSPDIDKFMSTHVSRYVLPKRLDAAESASKDTVSVPVNDMVRLLERTGHTVGMSKPADKPEFPAALDTIVEDLLSSANFADYPPDISELKALLSQTARMAYVVPRTRQTRNKLSTAETVYIAQADGKKLVTVPTSELAAMLAKVDKERELTRKMREHSNVQDHTTAA